MSSIEKRIKEQMQSSDAASVPFLMTVTFARSLQVAVHPTIPSQSGRIAVLLFNLLDKPIYFRNRFIGQFVVSQIDRQLAVSDRNGAQGLGDD